MIGAEVALLSFVLFGIAMLYSSVGHGGASGYLAVMSLATIATLETAWLKQHAWSLNLVVSAIAFYHFRKEGHHVIKLSIPFVLGGVPFAFLGGYLAIDGAPYDTVLSVVLLLAAVRLLFPTEVKRREDSWGIGFLPCVVMGWGWDGDGDGMRDEGCFLFRAFFGNFFGLFLAMCSFLKAAFSVLGRIFEHFE